MNPQDQNPAVATPQKQYSFNPSVIKRSYTPSEWKAKEDWYTNQVNGIRIGECPTPAEVQSIACQIDALLSMARIDFAYISQNYDRLTMQLKIEERRLFVDLKLQPPVQYQGMKLTVDDMKGVVASVIYKNTWDNTKYSLYTLVQESSARHIFMEAVIKTLQDKKDLLITHSGMLKIENSLSAMSPSVPNSQPNL